MIKRICVYLLIIIMPYFKLHSAGISLLKTNMYPLGIAQGGAVVADIYGPQSLYWNTAGISRDLKFRLAFTHMMYYVQTTIDNVAVVLPLENLAIAVAFTYFSSGDIDKYGDAPSDEGVEEIFKLADTILNFGLGFKAGNFHYGFGLKGYTTKYYDLKSSCYMFDFGMQYHNPGSPDYFGLAIRNLGTKLNYFDDSVFPPYRIQIGYSRELMEDVMKISNDVVFEILDLKIKYNLGVQVILTETMKVMLGWEKINFKDFKKLDNVAAGLYFDMGNVKFTYSIKYHSLLGLAHSVGLILRRE